LAKEFDELVVSEEAVIWFTYGGASRFARAPQQVQNVEYIVVELWSE
jgi:hypothetical protein